VRRRRRDPLRVNRNRNWSGYHAQAAGVYRVIDLEAAQAEHHKYRRHMQYLHRGAYIGKAAGWAQKLSKPILDDITRHARVTARRISPSSPRASPLGGCPRIRFFVGWAGPRRPGPTC